MTILGLPDFLGKPLAVAVIDLLLAGDNALVLALVCRALPPRRLRTVLAIGTLGAVLLRIVLVGLAGSALAVPGLKATGGALLCLLAVNLALPDRRRADRMPTLGGSGELLAAAILVILIDVMMSLDNVVALAAVAGDSIGYLALGLGLSVAILMFGSGVVAAELRRRPGLGRLGAALLGWIGGQMVLGDRLLDAWIAAQAPALPLVVPGLAAVYVYLLGDHAKAPEAMAQTARRAPPDMVPTARTAAAAPPGVAAPPVARPMAASAAAPVLTVPAVSVEERSASPQRVELVLFVGMFVVGGVFLGVALLFGGGLLAH